MLKMIGLFLSPCFRKFFNFFFRLVERRWGCTAEGDGCPFDGQFMLFQQELWWIDRPFLTSSHTSPKGNLRKLSINKWSLWFHEKFRKKYKVRSAEICLSLFFPWNHNVHIYTFVIEHFFFQYHWKNPVFSLKPRISWRGFNGFKFCV